MTHRPPNAPRSVPASNSWLHYAAAPVFIVGFSAAAWSLHALGYSLPLAVALSLTSSTIAVAGLERMLPYKQEWRRFDKQVWNDLGHMTLASVVGTSAGNRAAEALFGWIGVWLASYVSMPRYLLVSWPLVLQLVAVWLLAELGRYVQHRLHHRYLWMWDFHKLHHSVQAMGVLKTTRSHLVERVLQQLFMIGPLFLIGTPPWLVASYIVPSSLIGQLDHSNADVRFGILDRIFTGPAAHRYHHATDMGLSNSNFGSAMVIWDRLFGTFSDPRTAGDHGPMGIDGDDTPDGFQAQVLLPFRDAFRKKNGT